MIEIIDLYKSFGKLEVLKGINEHIEKGEVVVVIGPSGSGKSTFLRCINLMEQPTKGQILFEGVDITSPKTNINLIRQKVGMVFQHFNLFPHMNVMENLTLAPIKLKGYTKEQAEEIAYKLLD
ncbi:MAG: amino acid ABC transporter ATP-binding protein, partial [Epulopiscium sp.]|nr:amino acid ABC transporter ATP-binding protein [Candidatus Epulonipiscium sp.]